jgi:uncharacterized iron-regulated protein
MKAANIKNRFLSPFPLDEGLVDFIANSSDGDLETKLSNR